jgi:hypothetical protein
MGEYSDNDLWKAVIENKCVMRVPRESTSCLEGHHVNMFNAPLVYHDTPLIMMPMNKTSAITAAALTTA